MMNKKYDICFFLGGIYNGGQERQLHHLMNGIDRHKYDIALIVWRHNDMNVLAFNRFKKLGIDIMLLQGGKLQKFKDLRRLIEIFQVKILHSYTFYINFIVYLACLGTRTKGIGGFRSTYGAYRKNLGLILSTLNVIFPKNLVTNSYYARDEVKLHFATIFKVIPKRMFVVVNSLDLSDFSLENKNSLLRRTISIGRLVETKRWDILVKGLYQLKEKGYPFEHMVVGSGKLEEKLKNLINKLDMVNNIQLCGEVENVQFALGNADFLIHTAEAEGTPNVIMEAMASGKAVVTTNCGDSGLLIEDGVNGFLIEIGDTNALSEKIEFLFNNPEVCKEMGEKGRIKAFNTFGIENLVFNTFEVYKSIGINL